MPPRRAPGSAWGLGALTDDWRCQAACRDEDPELFFPIGTSGPALRQIEQAKAVCRRCPVIDACREYALAHDERHGVWGGLSEAERDKLLRHREARERVGRVLDAVAAYVSERYQLPAAAGRHYQAAGPA